MQKIWSVSVKLQNDFSKQDTNAEVDISYANTIPPMLISDDSENMIARQDHEGSDSAPDSSRAGSNT